VPAGSAPLHGATLDHSLRSETIEMVSSGHLQRASMGVATFHLSQITFALMLKLRYSKAWHPANLGSGGPVTKWVGLRCLQGMSTAFVVLNASIALASSDCSNGGQDPHAWIWLSLAIRFPALKNRDCGRRQAARPIRQRGCNREPTHRAFCRYLEREASLLPTNCLVFLW